MTTYPANWRVPTGIKLYGANIIPSVHALTDFATAQGVNAATIDWEQLFSNTFTSTYYPTMFTYLASGFARLKALGCNFARIWGAWPEGAYDYSLYTAAAHAIQVRDICRLAASYGIYVVINASVGKTYHNPPRISVADMTTWMAVLAAALDAEPNIAGIDCANESFNYYSQANLTAFAAAAHGASTIPITCSQDISASGDWAAFNISKFNATGLDFLQIHPYYTWLPSDISGMEGITSVPILIGETGTVTFDNATMVRRWHAGFDSTRRDSVAGCAVWSGNWGLYSGAFDPWGQNDAVGIQQYVPRTPLTVPFLDTFKDLTLIDADAGNASWLNLQTRPAARTGAISGWLARSGDAINQVIVADSNYGYATTSDTAGGTAGVAYLSEILPYKDLTLTANLRCKTADATAGKNQIHFLMVRADPFTGLSGSWDTTVSIGAGWSHYGAGGPGWEINKLGPGGYPGTQLGWSSFALVPGNYKLEVILTGGGTTIQLKVNGSSVIGPVAIGTFTGPNPGRVGSEAGGASSSGGWLDFAIAQVAPAVADTVAFQYASHGLVSLSTSGSSGLSSRQWHRYTASGSPLSTKTAVAGATSATLIDTGLTTGQIYYYATLGTDSLGNTYRSNEVSAVPP